ncbi:MAG: spore photoproduct lyase family protein, partial [Syntrophorhabdales bacterium]
IGAARIFIPWFARQEKGYLFMLTKSDNVDHILPLHHNRHTILCWSLNAPSVSAQYEIGAPSFERRLAAAHKVELARYRLRVRLDPIVPVPGWQKIYADTVRRIFQKIRPERITLGTLRFEEQFCNMRDSLVAGSSDLRTYMEEMTPMFDKKVFQGKKRPKVGKYSFDEEKRIEIFRFVMNEIWKYSHLPIALCKESRSVWDKVGLDVSDCQCVCQLESADMSQAAPPVP